MAGGERFVDREEIAFLLDVEPRTITNWVRQHPDFPSRVRGRHRDFPVNRCLRWKRDRDVAEAVASLGPGEIDDASEADKRKAIAEAEFAEIRVDKLRREVALVSETGKIVGECFGRIRASLLAKPGEYASRVLNLASVAEAVPVLRQMMDDVLAELQVVAGSGLVDDDDDGGDDPEPEAPPEQAAA